MHVPLGLLINGGSVVLVFFPVEVLCSDYLRRLKVLLSAHIFFTMKVQTAHIFFAMKVQIKSTFMGI